MADLTVGEIITNHGKMFLNIGSETVALDQNFRDRTRFYLTILAKRVWDLAPFWFRLARNASLSVAVNDESVAMPADFSHAGDQMQIYLSGFPFYQLTPVEPDELNSYRRMVGSATVIGRPTTYTLEGVASTGRPLLQFWPKANQPYTLLVDEYVQKTPDLIDRPGPPTAAIGAAGALSGVYSYLVTFVTALGETEAGVVSNSITLAAQKGNLSGIPVSPARAVTARKIYRTAAGGTTYGLVTTISDNTTTTLTGDDLVDGSLGVAPPTLAAAVTGIERFPADAVERLFVEGLRTLSGTAQGDLRDRKWMEDWMKTVINFWGEYKQGRNEPLSMPRYGVIRGVRAGFYPRWI